MHASQSNRHKKILDDVHIYQKIKRIAHQIYENNFEETTLFLAGISGGGGQLAQLIADDMRHISPIKIQLMTIMLDKNNPHTNPVQFDISPEELQNQVIIVVDDVLNTGRTLAYSLSPFLGVKVKRVQVAVMVNRGHSSFPIQADYVGYSLSTTLDEHISVVLEKDNEGVFIGPLN
jgi:pyrimidine operon attenuation protein / uracil phosphoribosyltransferase